MHLVFLNATGSLGGAERVLLTLLQELKQVRPDWRMTVLAGNDGLLRGAVRDLGCEVEIMALPEPLKLLGDWGVAGKGQLLADMAHALPALIQYRRKLRRRLRELAPTLVQTNGFKMHVIGALACPRGTRLIWHLHDFASNRFAMKILLRWCFGRPDTVVAISEAVATDLRTLVRRTGKIRTIWNAVPQPALPTPAGGESVRIGLIATFARWKGHEVFLRALALLPPELTWTAVIVGGEVYSRAASQYTEAELRRLSAQLGLEGKVEFTGFVADPAGILASLDIVVHASTEPEPFGLVIAEGMAAGKAVVTSSNALITSGVDGLTHTPGDAAQLARALELLVRNPALRVSLGQAARAAAKERFQPVRMAREFLVLYETA